MSGVPGPVFVELPIDVLYDIGEIRAAMGLSVRKKVKVRLAMLSIGVPEQLRVHLSTGGG
jgi:hypothetical protein